MCNAGLFIGRDHVTTPIEPTDGLTLEVANIRSGRYVYMEDLRELEKCTDDGDLMVWPTCPSPVHVAGWGEYIRAHPDQDFGSYIYRGLSTGFCIGFDRRRLTLKSSVRNHRSAVANTAVVRGYIKTEVDAGRLVGPLGKPARQKVHTSPIGLIPKSQPNQWRMIVDLSFPMRGSVNDGIASDLASITYASVDDAVRLILQLGRGTQLVKLDLKNSYRIVPVHPQDQHLLGISWEGKSYADRALPFGLRSAPKIFSAVADMIAWALHCAGVQHQIHYLADFLFLGAPATGEAGRALGIALRVLEQLGVPIASQKTEGPACCLTLNFWGS